MPDPPEPKIKPDLPARPRVLSPVPYAELAVTSNFSFLRGGSHPEELVATAAALGYRAIALTDLHSLAGVVRAHTTAQDCGLPFLVGCRLELYENYLLETVAEPSGTESTPSAAPPAAPPADVPPSAVPSSTALSLLVYPTSLAAYGRLCQLLTLGKRRSEKGSCRLTLPDLVAHQAGLLAIVLPPPQLDETFTTALQFLRQLFDDDRLSLAISRLYHAADEPRLAALADLAARRHVPLVAINDVYYHDPQRRPLQDVLTCIRLGCTLSAAGFALFPNAERHLKTPEEMARLFQDYPAALARTLHIAARAGAFSLAQLHYEYPHEVCPPGTTLMEHLIALTEQGAAERYPAGVPQAVRQTIAHEFQLIAELNYPAYFLTVYDIVRWARARGILCQGRGAAANSAVCYCLGITAVDPERIHLLFERFISKERNEPPDIDIDFEHERREEVIQYIYTRFGRQRAALTAEVITYRRRSAIRDVGKALGLPLDTVERLATAQAWWDQSVLQPDVLRPLGLDPADPVLAQLAALAGELRGFPRHRSQHVGGFVITEGPLCDLVPIENAAMPDRTIIEWDKDDIDALGILKIDVLALGMLTAIRKAIDLVNAETAKSAGFSLNVERWTFNVERSTPNDWKRGDWKRDWKRGRRSFPTAGKKDLRPLFQDLQFHTIPPEDPAVYAMLCRADSVGVFQVESRAQMSMLPRLRPQCYYDLVIQVAIVRPGPIQGHMVHPYLRRRNKEEPESYPNAAIRQVLGRTLGVPLFQEQVMALAIVAAGFTPGQADALRRAMAAWKRKGDLLQQYSQTMAAGMLAHGYSAAFAAQVFQQIQGFGEYGFPESHAASFALLVYVSAWLKKHHPAASCAALLNSQPMGFYAPAQLVRDARDHGVEVLPIDVHCSRWDCSLERGQGVKGPRKQEVVVPTLDPSTPRPLDPSLRLGLRLVRSLRQTEADKLTTAVARHGPFTSMAALWRASGVRVATLRALAEADAFNSMGLDRQAALWSIAQLRDTPLPMFDPPVNDTPDTDAQSSRSPDETLRMRCTPGTCLFGVPPLGGVLALGVDAPTAQSHVKAPLLTQGDTPPHSQAPAPPEPRDPLPEISPARIVVYDYQAIGLSLKAHPLAFIRDHLARRHVIPAAALADPRRCPDRQPVIVAGLVLVRQRPGTASGIVFMTIEDETGHANLIVRPHIFDRFRHALAHSTGVIAWGRIERQGQVVHVLVHRAQDLTALPVYAETLDSLDPASRDFH